MNESQNLTLEELEQGFDFLAKKLALLLADSDLDMETQETLIEALPHMELEHIIDLISTLEAKYTAAKTANLDSDLRTKLQEVESDFTSRQTARDEALLKDLADLLEELDQK